MVPKCMVALKTYAQHTKYQILLLTLNLRSSSLLPAEGPNVLRTFLWKQLMNTFLPFTALKYGVKFMQLYNVDINPQRLDGKDNAPTLILSIPGKWGMFSHSYGCGQRIQCPLCTSARAFANFPFPWAPHMSHPPNMRRNNLELDEQQRSTMAVSAYQLMQDIFR